MLPATSTTRWRTTGAYTPINASKAGLLYETRCWITYYVQSGDSQKTREALVNGILPQRSRETRRTIVTVIQQRLQRWFPPQWVYEDLWSFAEDEHQPSLKTSLLLHVVRQDHLLYDFVQQIVVSSWEQGERVLTRADVQRFLDLAAAEHAETERWSHATREKLAGNVLSILRDYGLLSGREQKYIVEPIVPTAVVNHLIRLLRAEGIEEEAIPYHPDWRIWLWSSQRAEQAVAAFPPHEITL